MADIRIQFNTAGFRALRTSAAVDALLNEKADAVADGANAVASTTDPAATEPYYEVQDGSDAERARYRVVPAPGEQLARNIRHEARTQALEKGLGSA